MKRGEKYYRSLIENALDLVQVLESDGTFRFISPAVEKALGYKTNEILGKNFAEVVHPDDLPEVKKDFTRTHIDPTCRLSKTLRLRHKDGTWHFVEGVLTNLLDDPVVRGIVINSRDITERKRAEEALAREREYYRTFLESLTDWAWEMDAHGVHTYSNAAVKDILGFTVDEVVGHHVTKLWHDGSKTSEVLQWLQSSLASGKGWRNFRGCFKRKDGATVLTESTAIPIFSSEGNLVGYRGLDRDITARHRAEEESRRAHADLNQILNASVPLCVIGTDFSLLRVNENYCSKFLMRREDILGKKCHDLWYGPTCNTPGCAMKQILGGKEEYEYEWEEIHHDNSTSTYKVTAVPYRDPSGEIVGIIENFTDITELKRFEEALRESEERYRMLVETMNEGLAIQDGEGNFVGSFGVITDITERKRAERTMQESQLHYRRMFDSMGDAIHVVDADMRIVMANRALRDLTEELGLRSDLVGLSIFDAFPFLSERVREEYNQVFSTGEPVVTEETNTVENREIITETRKIPVFEEGRATGIVTIIRDITERKTAESRIRRYSERLEELVEERTARIRELERERAEREKLAAAGRMVARIAHEINNPLGGIKNSFLLVKDAISNDHPYYRYVEVIEKEIDRIAGIVRQMFDLHRPDHEVPIRFSIGDVVGEVIALLQAKYFASGVHIETDIKGSPEAISLPENLLRQVLYNLIKNAIEASPIGGCVKVETKVSDGSLTINVSDEGCGIPESMRSQVFEPFFTTKENLSSGGLGLGLSISKSLVEAMKGSLGFQSAPGKGTLFRVSFPLNNDRGEV